MGAYEVGQIVRQFTIQVVNIREANRFKRAFVHFVTERLIVSGSETIIFLFYGGRFRKFQVNASSYGNVVTAVEYPIKTDIVH